MAHKIIDLRVISLLLFSNVAYAAGWTADLSSGDKSVEFTAVGKPKAIKIVGKSEELSGKISLSQGRWSVAESFLVLDSLDSGISLRDDHMKKKYLETAKYPKAHLKITSFGILPAKAQGDFTAEKVPFQAQLLLHGITRPVKGVMTLKKDANQLQVDAEFVIKINEYKITIPEYMGIKVADEVQVQVHTKSKVSPIP